MTKKKRIREHKISVADFIASALIENEEGVVFEIEITRGNESLHGCIHKNLMEISACMPEKNPPFLSILVKTNGMDDIKNGIHQNVLGVVDAIRDFFLENPNSLIGNIFLIADNVVLKTILHDYAQKH